MSKRFERQSMLLGEEATATLATKKVALFGVGGVGSYVAEALARCGIGKIELIDSDTVAESNINRQLCALTSTVGRPKVSVVADRLKDINPDIEITERMEFFLPENADTFDFSSYDYVIDAIDTVSAKIEIAVRCAKMNIPMISSMGTGNKLDPTALRVSDLSKTEGCPLARVMRRELKARGITHMKVVWSPEPPISPVLPQCSERGKPIPASIAFVPSVAGLIAAGEAVKSLIGICK
ncbi:MAG: tRNA threonylcarbamoyladenosine dehydratase [Clostridia bacterium]|nr:tRNA threonylcarbamoyladenosine dehydratase [Clostridia bacterium]